MSCRIIAGNGPSVHCVTAGVAALALLCAGCGLRGSASAVEQRMGEAHREAIARQTEHPERSERTTPVEGLGATTVVDVLENYHANQKTEAQERRQDRQRDNGLSDIDG